VLDAIRADRWKKLRENPYQSDETDLTGHLILIRERVAALLASMQGRRDVESEDWWLAGHLTDVSQREVERIRAALQQKAKLEREAAAVAAGHHEAKVTETTEELLTERALKQCIKHAGFNGMAKGKLRATLSAKNRKAYELAIALGDSRGALTIEKVEGRDGRPGVTTTMIYATP